MTQAEMLHNLELKIALEIKRVCDECGIRYFLYYGSLLGAVRHKGFIPWDDDLDIAMPRKDYERFIRVFADYVDKDKFFLENWYTENGFGLSFSKVKLNGTTFEEHSIKNADTHKGIYVDVFPLDLLPDDAALIRKTEKKLLLLGKLYKFRQGYLPTNPNDKKQHFLSKIIGAVGKLIPGSTLRGMILREETRYNNDSHAACTAVLSGPYHCRDVFHKELIEDLLPVPFETEIMCIPAGYDKILTSIYGDYMQFPPVEKRVFKHNPEQIDFGIYAGRE